MRRAGMAAITMSVDPQAREAGETAAICDFAGSDLLYGSPHLWVNEGRAFISFRVDNPTDDPLTEFVQIFALTGQEEAHLIGWEGCRVPAAGHRYIQFYVESVRGGPLSDGAFDPARVREVQIRSLSQVRARRDCGEGFELIKSPR